MLKGKSKIELFDGTSGKKVDEQVNENIVTNAVRNLLGFGNELLASGVAVHSLLDRVTPLYPAYLRGILLWDSNIPENADLIYAPPGVRCVGHAGGGYSGAKETRGTLNINETEVTENGVKMVWDFATDKANGVIKCLSLSSVLGGNCGWLTPHESNTFFQARVSTNTDNPATPSHLSFITTEPRTNLGLARYYAGEFRRGVHTYVADRGDNLLTILEQSFSDPAEIKLTDKLGSQHNDFATEKMFTVAASSPFSNLIAYSYVNGSGVLYHVLTTDGRNARVKAVNLVNKTVISDTMIQLNEAVLFGAGNAAAFFKSHIYAHSTTRGGICKYDSSGQFVERVLAANANAGWRYRCLGNDYLITGGTTQNTSADIYFTDGVNGSIIRTGDMSPLSVNAANLKPPFFIFDEIITSGNGTNKRIGYVTPYMATINNLTHQVEKTGHNTMKITYELTQT
ncbi:MAG: hypothetical protein FWE60_04645 [Oscillospiraceae bacterium]|nr:hypothetical protein [Oscillospiraceae bacterium]